MKQILIATPAYDFKVHVDYLTTLINFLKTTPNTNITLINVLGNSLITQARDYLITFFIEHKEFDYMLFWDSDIGVPEDALFKLMCRNKDVIGLPVPLKTQQQMGFSMGKILNREGELAEVTGIPTAFMLISRRVADKLEEEFKDKKYKSPIKNGVLDELYAIFKTELIDDIFYGEDYTFCNELRRLGFKIYADLSIPVRHWGSYCFFGNFSNLENKGSER